eukprot:1368391-Amorphochlora_amoeboformis.AAC.1
MNHDARTQTGHHDQQFTKESQYSSVQTQSLVCSLVTAYVSLSFAQPMSIGEVVPLPSDVLVYPAS